MQLIGSRRKRCEVLVHSTTTYENYVCAWLRLLQGLELDEADTNPHANSDGFFPLLATLLDYPFPTIALITGHTFGGACPFALSHDYRIMLVPSK